MEAASTPLGFLAESDGDVASTRGTLKLRCRGGEGGWGGEVEEDGLANEDNANFYAWLEIASVQKLIGDYDRAIKIWTWFTEIYSGNSISPANLGDLYKSFVVDKEKSEKYYKIALEREKHDFQIYYGFYELYRYVFDDADKAIAVLQDGMANNPDRKDYLTELINYLISLDRRDQASAVIENWIAQHPEDFSLKARLQ